MSRRLLFLFALFVLVAALLFAPVPFQPTSAGRTLENAGHMPAFLLVTLGFLIVLRADFGITGARLYALAGLAGAAAGFLSEVLQQPLRRDASWEDVFADFVGVVCALALFALFDRRTEIAKAARLSALVVALVCIVASVTPIVRMTRAYLHRNGQFPVLVNFQHGIELYWTVGYGINRKIVRDALEVDFEADEFPGVSLHEPVPDWRNFATLVLDVENPASVGLDLGIRVHDRGHGRTYFDRFTRGFKLAAGERREIKIALGDIRRGPRDRLMDMGHISDITLFHGSHTGSRRLRVYSARLE